MQPHGAPAESDRPGNLLIFGTVVALGLALALVLAGLEQYFTLTMQREVSAKVLEKPSTALREARARDEARLARYQWVDRKAGVVRIPADRAAELLLSEWAAEAPPPAPQAPPPAPPAGAARRDR